MRTVVRERKSIVILLMSDVLTSAKRQCNKTVLRKSILFIKVAWVASYNGYSETAQTASHDPLKGRKAENVTTNSRKKIVMQIAETIIGECDAAF